MVHEEINCDQEMILNRDRLQIALLIDCDNAPAKSIEGVINQLSKYGVVNIRNAYGDWKSSYMKSWEPKLHKHAIIPIQQFAYTSGKNATDIAMSIDAMEILYTKKVQAFALMTSDSDFTPLVTKLMSNGMQVFGFGENKTPEPFINACSQFIYTENLIEADSKETKPKEILKEDRVKAVRKNKNLIKMLENAIEKTSDDSGWSYVARVGTYLSNNSSFSTVNYGYQKLGELLKAVPSFEIKMEKLAMYVKIKDS
jgi:uncharacterized protein (TIGR00288 family)